ncbi:MAG: biotin--[Clostridia bacterium]|nr:biotin--[acetyl-CoA-carboxylase] ligase [Clostridia bacterium]
MKPSFSPLDEKTVRSLLPRERAERVFCYDTVSSTNTVLSAMEDAPAGTCLVADRQTAGRGRRGRSFVSPAGMGIYLSYLLRPDAPADAGRITASAAVAARRAIRSVCGIECGIKWVNDLVIGEKKIGGILAEGTVREGALSSVIVGIGLNVAETEADFPAELRKTAGSLFSETKKSPPRARLAAALIGELDRVFAGEDPSVFSEYETACVTLGREVVVCRGEETYLATALRLEPDFSLTVRGEDGVLRRVFSGEASVRGKEGYLS